MKRLLQICLLLPAMAFAQVPGDHANQMKKSQAIFADTVRPFLEANCLECHGGKKMKSGFSLLSRSELLAGGDLGEAVVSGDPDASPMVAMLEHREEPHMPPKKPKTDNETLAAVREWIALGAAYDKPFKGAAKEGPMEITEEDRAYWAFQPVKENEKGESIDGFVEAAWKTEGLTPAAEADRRTLIRRASFDLTGLPPTLEEIHGFLNDDNPGAWERVIDRLLDSPQYGERWARHWLDVARFAESHGFEHDYDRPHAYHYRDYLIKALNNDQPYDEFIKWQMAGDEIAPDNPQAMLATGFLGAGVYPTQITVNEAERIRYDAMDDMLNTAGQAILGLTIGCARCHDHKYDPIPVKDYYEMLSAFTTTVRTEIDLAMDGGPELTARQVAHDKKIEAARDAAKTYVNEMLPSAFEKWVAQNPANEIEEVPVWSLAEVVSLTAKHGTTFTQQADGSYLAGGKNPQFEVYTVEVVSERPTTAVRIEALADDSMVGRGPGRASNGNFGLTELRAYVQEGKKWRPVRLELPEATFNQNGLGIDKAIDGTDDGCWAVDPQFGKDHAGVFHFAEAVTANQAIKLELNFHCNGKHAIGRPRFSLSSQPAPVPATTGEAAVSLEAQMHQAISSDETQEEQLALFRKIDPKARELDVAVTKLVASRPTGDIQKVMVCTEGSHIRPMRRHTQGKDFYEPTYHLNRGDSNQKGDVADFNVLRVLNPGDRDWFEEPPKDAKTTWHRRGLVNWMMDIEKGGGALAARVMANRVWMWHMGRGIVNTPSDFGYQSAAPTHPELLDYLAGRLMANGWRLKPFHREIMTSRVYRLGNAVGESVTLDPENKWLSRRVPQRLEAEAIRDNLLAISGLLDDTMYGKGTLSDSSRRRSIYFMVKRSRLIPMLQVFDWPDTLTSCGERQNTTTSPQALFFLNNPQVRQWAEAFMKRVVEEDDPLGTAWELATGQLISNEQRSSAETFVEAAGLTEFCHALLSANATSFVE